MSENHWATATVVLLAFSGTAIAQTTWTTAPVQLISSQATPGHIECKPQRISFHHDSRRHQAEGSDSGNAANTI